MFIHFHIVCGCSRATTSELRSCGGRDHITRKASNTYQLVYYKMSANSCSRIKGRGKGSLERGDYDGWYQSKNGKQKSKAEKGRWCEAGEVGGDKATEDCSQGT